MSRGHVRYRTSRPCSARSPFRSLNAGRCRSGAGRDTIQTRPAGRSCSLICCCEKFEVHRAFPAADDLAVAFGREQVSAESELRAVFVAFEIKRLDRRPENDARKPARRNGRKDMFHPARRSRRPIRICFRARPPGGLPAAFLPHRRNEFAETAARSLPILQVSRSSTFSSSLRSSKTRPTMWAISPSPSSITSSRCAKATSGSTIQNSVRWRRVFDFSARKTGPKQ